MLERILTTGIIAAEIGLTLAGCQTTEQEMPKKDLFAKQVILASEQEETPQEKIIEQEKKIMQIKEIIAKNNVEHIDQIFLYTPQRGKELLNAIEQNYGHIDKRFFTVLDYVQDKQSLMVILPVESIGQNKGSYICFFRKMAEEIKTPEDLASLIVDYAGTIAEINAKGITLNNTRIQEQEIRKEIGPVLYGAIVELRARTKQINNEQNLSEHYKKTIWGYYTAALLVIKCHDPAKNVYAREALAEAEQEMHK